jgi:hypothetical protein
MLSRVTDPVPELDPRKVRIGLMIVTAVFVVAAVLIVVIDDPFGRAVMGAVAAVAVVRAFLLSRSLRR